MAGTTRESRKNAARSRVLVTTDFSPAARHAIEVASQLAKALEAEVVLLHVDEPFVEVSRSQGRLRRRREAGAELERAAKALTARGLAARWTLRVGKPAREILDAAVAERVVLIVVGMQKQRAAISALLGGVAYEVLRKAPCPVLTVRVSDAVPTDRGKAAGATRTSRRPRSRPTRARSARGRGRRRG